MSQIMLLALLKATWQTIYMVFVSGALASVLGIPLGFLLFCTRCGNILENKTTNKIVSALSNAVRSIPFIILLIAIIPLTRLIVGTSIGTTAAIVPLTIGAIPFVARIVENALEEVPHGLVEMGLSIGATPLQIIRKILLPEALPSIINGLTVTVIALVAYSAMAGAVGGGGLGDLAIRYGYQRFELNIMLITIAVLIAMVQLIQTLGDKISKQFNH